MTNDLQEGIGQFSHLVLTTHNLTLSEFVVELREKKKGLDVANSLIEAAQVAELGEAAYLIESQPAHGALAAGSGQLAKLKRPFMYLAVSICKYAKGDPELKKRLDDASQEFNAHDLNNKGQSFFNTAILLGLAEYVLKHVPGLDGIGPCTLAGILLIVCAIGMDAFCSWVQDECMAEKPKIDCAEDKSP